MRDIRDGQMVTICKHPAHALPVFVAGQRAIEITEEPTRINWNGYYHQLRAEGAILVMGEE
ncbi:MAG: hypothetical protein KBE22_02080 [Candidatus Accumulibacter sp.]|jgi:hypothetical protein|nr:hypothetical protein [Accumulibacter sp.]